MFESGRDRRKGDVEEEGIVVCCVVDVGVVAESIVGDGISGEK